MNSAQRKLPGPRGWPLVGDLFQINPARLHTTLEQWAERFGPMHVFRFGRIRSLAHNRADYVLPLGAVLLKRFQLSMITDTATRRGLPAALRGALDLRRAMEGGAAGKAAIKRVKVPPH